MDFPISRKATYLIVVLTAVCLIGFFIYINRFRYDTVDFMGVEKINTKTNIITGHVLAQNPLTLEWDDYAIVKTTVINSHMEPLIFELHAVDDKLSSTTDRAKAALNALLIDNSEENVSAFNQLVDESNKLLEEKARIQNELNRLNAFD